MADIRRTYKESRESKEKIDRILLVRPNEFTGFSDVINAAIDMLYTKMGIESDYFAMCEQGHANNDRPR